MKKWGFQKLWYEIGPFGKAECLIKTVKKCFLKKLSVWLAFIKVVVLVINYQKGQNVCVYIYIYKGVYFILSINFFLIIIIIITSC